MVPISADNALSQFRKIMACFRQMLSLCTINVEHSEPGTEVIVVWGEPGEPQKAIQATVAPAPYKQDNRRIDVSKFQTGGPTVRSVQFG